MEHLKNLGIQELHLILHNMRIYGASDDKRKKVINEINKRESNDASNK